MSHFLTPHVSVICALEHTEGAHYLQVSMTDYMPSSKVRVVLGARQREVLPWRRLHEYTDVHT